MKNNKKHDKLYVNEIENKNDIESLSEKPVSNADNEPSCIYANKRHAVGSKINLHDTQSVCTDKGTWENKK